MKKEKIVYFKYANPNPSQKYKKNGTHINGRNQESDNTSATYYINND